MKKSHFQSSCPGRVIEGFEAEGARWRTAGVVKEQVDAA
jgi:hypothetical protein